MIKLKSLLQEQTRLFKRGMRDPQAGTKTGPIAKIQQKLIDAGIMNPIPDTSYGIYGPKTAAAVKKFQEKQFPNNPKEWDGVVGPKTTAELDKLVTVDDFDFKVDYGSNMPGMSTYVAGADREDIEQRLNYMMLQTPQKQDQQTMNKITSKEPESDEGWFQYIRKGFPNVVQLLKGKSLTTADFTDEQQKILLNVIQQSAKRLNRTNSGSTKYIDYGQEVASKFQNEKGSPSTWEAAWGAITFDMKFAMATLLGRFNWNKNSDGTYTITDKYDFKDPRYAAISGINRESLEGKSISELQDEYDLSYYEAARVKGWVDYPDNIPEKALSVNLTIDPTTLT
jgi:hypothetical protein